MRKLVETKMGQEEQAMVVASSGMNKSDKIKAMFEGGLDTKEISTLLGIRYNHAYNVVQNYCLVNGIDVEKSVRSTGGTKKAEIEAYLNSGASIMETAKATMNGYNRVWQIKNEMDNRAAKAVTNAATMNEPKKEELILDLSKEFETTDAECISCGNKFNSKEVGGVCQECGEEGNGIILTKKGKKGGKK